MPMLLLNGDLDPQTPYWWAIDSAIQYGANNYNDKDRYYYTIPTAPHFVMFDSPIVNTSSEYDYENCAFIIMKSFINNGNWKPNTDCIKWIEPIDWKGSTNTSKQMAMIYFGTNDMWGIEQGTHDTDQDTIIWVIVVGVIIILIVLLLFAYRDYRKRKNEYDDKAPLLDAPKKPVAYTDKY